MHIGNIGEYHAGRSPHAAIQNAVFAYRLRPMELGLHGLCLDVWLAAFQTVQHPLAGLR